MASYPFYQVDAFADTPLNGNPCAIVMDADSLTSEQMQSIAREQNLSETAFILHSDRADIRARYFTPSEEIPLAGHPTIASVHLLVERGYISVSKPVTRIELELEAGIIPVEILTTLGKVNEIVMSQLKPQFLSLVRSDDALSAFGLSIHDLIPEKPIQIVSTGTPQLMIPVREIDCLRRIQVDPALLTQLRHRYDFFGTHLFTISTSKTFARHFVNSPGVFEDPFTGSATGGMGAFLWHYDLIKEPVFTACQGDWMGRPGQARVTITGSRDDITGIHVAGQAVTVIAGTLQI